MRAALATLFALSLSATPLAGQERQLWTRPALPSPGVGLFSVQATLAQRCIESQRCVTNEGMSEGRRRALFTGGGAVLGGLLAYAVCGGAGRDRRQAEEAKKEGACSQSRASFVLGGAFVGALAGHIAFMLTRVNDAEPASPSMDMVTFRIPIG